MLQQYSFKQIMNLLVITSLLLIESIDANILNIAIPQIAAQFGSNIFIIKLAVTSYIVGSCIFIPISGWFANKFGIRNILIFSILIFICSSFGCAQSTRILSLVTYRFIQGASAAFMFPVSRLLMLKIFKKNQIVKVYTLITVPVLLGPILAPVTGALLLSWGSWRYIFLVNIPLGLLMLLGAMVYVENHREAQKPFNILNFILLSIFIGSLSAYLDICLVFYFNFYTKISLLSTAVFFGALCFWREKCSSRPVIKYHIFKIRTFQLCFISTLIVRLALGSRGFIIPIFLQISFHLSPLNTSLVFASMTIGVLVARPFMGVLLSKFGFKKALTIMNLCSSASLFMLGTLYQTGLAMNIYLFFNGFFASGQFMILNTMYYADIEQKDYSMAVSVASMWQQLTNALAIIFVSNILYISNFANDNKISVESFKTVFFILAGTNFVTQLFINKLHNKDGRALLGKL
jgi:MFS family permease